MLAMSRVILIVLLTYLPVTLYAAPKSDLWPFWKKENPSNQQTIDHRPWQEILNQYLVTQGQHNLFRYNAVSKQDKAKLKQYIQTLSKLDPRTYKKDVQFAYWVNLYNALTVNLILENYPVSSIKKIGGFFNSGPWNNDIIKIAGQSLTLNDIEHRILRPIWQDSRIHYVVNCASFGCPNLPTTALTAKNKDAQLDQASYQFVNSPKGVSIQGNTLVLSSIYDWYGVDFGNNQQQIFATIDKYRKGTKLQQWQGKVKYDYDWKLNEIKK